ncbi:MAG: GntR family transcriptional regulator [Kurthia sp.]|nr:GntR family transcriptional regulator [Candidatus Kurthia equi]
MTIDFNRDTPIYTQLVERICSEIIRNERRLGAKMPSVREYALEVGVNVNTIQRVYKELEHLQLTETRRGQGTFITANEQVIIDMRQQVKSKLIAQFFEKIDDFGFTKEEIMTEINRFDGGSVND